MSEETTQIMIAVSTESGEHITAASDPGNGQGVAYFLLLVSQSAWFKAGMAIQRYYYPFIIVLGMIGNILSLVVMLKKHNRRISCCVYMGVLAVSDSMCLFVGGYYWTLTDAPPPLQRPIKL